MHHSSKGKVHHNMEGNSKTPLFKTPQIELEVKNWLEKRASKIQYQQVTKVLNKLYAKSGKSWESRPSSGKPCCGHQTMKKHMRVCAY